VESHNKYEGEICAEEGEGIFVVEGRVRRST